MRVRHILPLTLSFSLCCFLVLFSGCSDATPALTSVEATVIYEYDHPQKAPRQRLSVFVQEAEGTERIMELMVSRQEAGIQWQVGSPLVVYNGSQVKAGSANLLPPYFSPVPQGQYQVTYMDLAGRTISGGFFLNYREVENLPVDQPVLSEKEDGESEDSSAEPVRKLAVYEGRDGQGKLLFLDKARSSWKSLTDIQKDYSDAKSLRLCLDYPSRQVRYLLPPQNIESGE